MYAIFSIRKLTATSRLNMAQIQLMDLDDQQYSLVTQKLNIENEQAQKQIQVASKLSKLYENAGDGEVNENEVKQLEQELTKSTAQATQKKNAIAYQENAIELQKKSLETVITKWTKELEVIEKAEEAGIERANPKYTGLG